jgi:hypothetical protein
MTHFDEESKLKSLRDTEHYRNCDFQNEYFRRLSEMGEIVEAAKVYVADNYQRVEDWAELSMSLRHGKETTEFGMKRAEREKRYPPKPKGESPKRRVRDARPETLSKMKKMLEEADERRVQVESVTEVVYDWTDGDFSLTINGKGYLWINYGNPDCIIALAEYVKKFAK